MRFYGVNAYHGAGRTHIGNQTRAPGDSTARPPLPQAAKHRADVSGAFDSSLKLLTRHHTNPS